MWSALEDDCWKCGAELGEADERQKMTWKATAGSGRQQVALWTLSCLHPQFLYLVPGLQMDSANSELFPTRLLHPTSPVLTSWNQCPKTLLWTDHVSSQTSLEVLAGFMKKPQTPWASGTFFAPASLLPNIPIPPEKGTTPVIDMCFSHVTRLPW